MGWFKRLKEGIQTTTSDKKEVPDGIWTKCSECKETTLQKDLKENLYVCPHCDHHTRIGSREYFHILFDNNKFSLLFEDLEAVDILEFEDLKKYSDRLESAKDKTGLKDAITVAVGQVEENQPLVIAAMDFAFIGGSMGSVVGEKISLAVDYCIAERIPLLIISKSGGARMMESAFSLMQMAKTAVKLGLLADANLPYISLMTDPTTGGVTASFSMLGDFNIAEPKALIGFAGPRVIKETIKQDLPEGFQSAEFLLEQGFLDFIVHRKDLKMEVQRLLGFFNLRTETPPTSLKSTGTSTDKEDKVETDEVATQKKKTNNAGPLSTQSNKKPTNNRPTQKKPVPEKPSTKKSTEKKTGREPVK